MDVSFDLYKVFYYVCEFKSVTKAANYLCVSQPAVTKHIKNLESIVGMDLIKRTPKGIELTDAGEYLYLKIKDPIEKLIGVSMDSTVLESINYTMHISCGISIARKFLLTHLSEFNSKYPNLKINIGSYYYRDSIQRLRDGKLDLVFLNLREGDDFGNDLIVKEFCKLSDILVASKNYKKIKITDLNEYPLIIKIGKSNSRKFIEKQFELEGKRLIPKYELSNHWLIEDYVSKNLGIGVVTKEFVEDKLDSGEYAEIKTDKKLPERTIVYAMRKNSRYNEIINKFINDIKKS